MNNFIKTIISALKAWVTKKIDESKIAVDWNQDDETAPDYIKNKPFYDIAERVLFEGQITLNDNNSYDFPKVLPFTWGEEYDVTINGITYRGTAIDQNTDIEEHYGFEVPDLGSITNYYVWLEPYNHYDGLANQTISIKITDAAATKVQKIPEKYLYASDWNQNNEIAHDYIKNRTHYTEIGRTIYAGVCNFDEFEDYLQTKIYFYVREINDGQYVTVYIDDVRFDGLEVKNQIIGNKESVLGFQANIDNSKGTLDFYLGGGFTKGEHKIVILEDTVHKLHEKYMPENMTKAIETVQITADNKMDKNDPAGTGSFSMNRKADTLIGDYSSVNGFDSIASAKYSSANGVGTVSNFVNMNATGSYNKIDTFCEEITRNLETDYGYNKYISVSYGETYSVIDGNYVLNNGIIKSALEDVPQGYYFITFWNGGYVYATQNHTIYRCVSSYSDGHIIYDKYHLAKENNDEKGKYSHVVGNGTSDEERSNAHTLDWHGNAWYSGDVYVGGTSQDDEEAKKLITEDYIDTLDLITIEDIDNICGDIIEEALPQSDVDELMARIEE